MVLTVVVVLLRRMLLLVGKGLLQQNLLLAVVMAGATGAGAGSIAAAAAAVCAVRNHLRCASGVCLILQCEITKVVERPGVHYRGRHSPGSSFVRSACRFLFFGFVRFLPLTQLLFARSAVSPKKNFRASSSARFCFSNTCTGFSERKFSRSHAHFDCFFFLFFAENFLCLRLGVIRKCTIFALLQRMIFSRSHCTCTFGFFLRFSLDFSDFSTNHSSSFFDRLLVC